MKFELDDSTLLKVDLGKAAPWCPLSSPTCCTAPQCQAWLRAPGWYCILLACIRSCLIAKKPATIRPRAASC